MLLLLLLLLLLFLSEQLYEVQIAWRTIFMIELIYWWTAIFSGRYTDKQHHRLLLGYELFHLKLDQLQSEELTSLTRLLYTLKTPIGNPCAKWNPSHIVPGLLQSQHQGNLQLPRTYSKEFSATIRDYSWG